MRKKIFLSAFSLIGLIALGLVLGLWYADQYFQEFCQTKGMTYQSLHRSIRYYTLEKVSYQNHHIEKVQISWDSPLNFELLSIDLYQPQFLMNIDDINPFSKEQISNVSLNSKFPLSIPFQVLVHQGTLSIQKESHTTILTELNGEIYPNINIQNPDWKILKTGPLLEITGSLSPNMQPLQWEDLQISSNEAILITYNPDDGANIQLSNLLISHPLLGRELLIESFQSNIQIHSDSFQIQNHLDKSSLDIQIPKNVTENFAWRQSALHGKIALHDLFQWFETALPEDWNIQGKILWTYDPMLETPMTLQLQDLLFQGDSDTITTLKFDQIPYLPIHANKVRMIGPSSPHWVPAHQLGWLPKALMAGEDVQFVNHHGLSEEGLAVALLDILNGSKNPKGGSTITQQLAKNIFVGDDKNISRKVQELAYSLALEHHLTKEQIWTVYLNAVEFGDNIYGIQQACDLYFLKHPSQLTLKESAFLIAILPNPIKGYAKALKGSPPTQRINSILKNMKDAQWISAAQYQEAKAMKLQLLLPID